ncbi:nuclear transport factor 2 family protein [Streptomyces sp. NEAU-174]|uniref:nuclear transport factor 2 family protein n=1 Tax=Streptomyces sp. NEAU-174 TaxID=3458254 RepID=UPI004044A1A3
MSTDRVTGGTGAQATGAEVLRRFIDAINTWDFDAIRDILDPDCVFEMPFAPGDFPRRIEGRAATVEFLSAMPDFIEPENLHDVTIHAFTDDPAELLAQYRSATRLRTTGAEYSNSYVVRARVRDRRLQRFAEFYDPVPLVVAMGGTVQVPLV